MLGRGNCERYTGCAVVQYYTVRLKGIENVAAATAIVALEKKEQCYIGDSVSHIQCVLWCNITM
jgi:hypothetical protein